VDWEEPPPRLKLGFTNWEKARAILTSPLPSLPINTLAEELVSRALLRGFMADPLLDPRGWGIEPSMIDRTGR
jgi:hypothetical protein